MKWKQTSKSQRPRSAVWCSALACRDKTQSYAGMPIANRYLIFQFPDKATHDKVWTDTKAWAQKALNAGHMSEFRVIGVEAAQPM